MKATIEWIYVPVALVRVHPNDDAVIGDEFVYSLTGALRDETTLEFKGLYSMYTDEMRQAIIDACREQDIHRILAERFRKDKTHYTKPIRVPAKREAP